MKKFIPGAIFLSLFFFSVQTASAASLTEVQIQAIVSLLSSFGVEAATVNNVNAILHGQANFTASTPVTASSTNQTWKTPSGAIVDGSGNPILVPYTPPPASFSSVDLKVNGQDGTLNVPIPSGCSSVPTTINKCPSITVSWEAQKVNWPGCNITSSLFSKNNLLPSGTLSVRLTKSTTIKITCPTDTQSVSDFVTVNLGAPTPADCTPTLAANVVKVDGDISTGIDFMFTGTLTLPVGCGVDGNTENDLQMQGFPNDLTYRGKVSDWVRNGQIKMISNGFTFSQGWGTGSGVNPSGTFTWVVGNTNITVSLPSN